MKVKITSDGTLRGTRVFDAENGEEIPKMIRVSMFLNWQTNNQPTATIELIDVQYDMVAEGLLITKIAGKKYQLVEL